MTQPSEDHARVFVACDLTPDGKDTIGKVIGDLTASTHDDVRWVRSDLVHLTLKFLGQVPQSQIPSIKMAIQEAVLRHSPFGLEFDGIGTFGGREGLRIMWIGIAGDVLRLEALVKATNAALAVVGFEPEGRPFRPHLTLGRVRDQVSTRRRAEIEVAVGKITVPDHSWRISQVSLIRSHLFADGPRYDVLATFPLRAQV